MDLPPSRPQSDTSALLADLTWTRGLARSLVQGTERAEELVQETWSRVLHNPAPPGVPDRSWIAGVMRRVVRDTARGSNRRKRREEAFAREHRERVDERHSQELEVHQDLVEHVQQLDPPLRRVLLLRYFDDMRLREIALHEGLQVSGVRSRLQRAHEQLRERLRDNPGTPAAALLLLSEPAAVATVPASATFVLAPVYLLAMKALLAAVGLALITYFGFRMLGQPDPVEALALVDSETVFVQPTDELLLGDNSTPGQDRVAPQADLEPSPVEEPTPVPAAVEVEGASLVVLVVDEQGQPVPDVPVMVGRTEVSTGWKGRTDAQGLAQVDSEWVIRERSKASGRGHIVRLSAPCGPEGVASVRLTELPDEPVKIVAPSASGSLDLEFVDDAGQPLSSVRLCTLSGVNSLGGIADVTINDPGTSNRYLFECLPLGQTFEIRLLVPAPWEFVDNRVVGPLVAGEVKHIQVPLAASKPTIRGRIVLEVESRGRLAPRYNASAETATDSQDTILVHLLSEADGTFHGTVRSLVAPGTPCTYLIRTSPFGRQTEEMSIEVESVVPGPGEIIDLGDLHLAESEAVVSGRVVDEAGQPVEGAHVRYVSLEEDTLQGTLMVKHSTRSSEDGQFQLKAYPKGGAYALKPRKSGYSSKLSDPVLIGDHGVVLVLNEPRELRGNILPCPGLSADSLYLWLDEVGEDGQSQRKMADIQPDWSFAFPGLVDTEHRFEVSTKNGSHSLLTIDRLQPVAEGQAQDQRLKNVDLSAKALAFGIEVVDSSGLPVSEVWARCGDQRLKGEAGVLSGVLRKDSEWLTLAAKGHRPVDLELDRLPQSVNLEKGVLVELVVPDDWPQGADRSQFEVRLGLQNYDLANEFPYRALPSGKFEGGSTLRLWVPGPGTYFPSWSARTAEGKFLDGTPFLEPLKPGAFEVVESSSPQVFDLGLD